MNRIEAARYIAETMSDDVEIDDNAEVTPVDHGIWVQAWVFVSNDDISNLLANPDRIPPTLREDTL